MRFCGTFCGCFESLLKLRCTSIRDLYIWGGPHVVVMYSNHPKTCSRTFWGCFQRRGTKDHGHGCSTVHFIRISENIALMKCVNKVQTREFLALDFASLLASAFSLFWLCPPRALAGNACCVCVPLWRFYTEDHNVDSAHQVSHARIDRSRIKSLCPYLSAGSFAAPSCRIPVRILVTERGTCVRWYRE